MINAIKALCRETGVLCLENEPLSRRTTFRIGGPADLSLFPRTAGQMRELLALLKESGTAFFVLGKGSNVLFPDEGFRGAVLFTEEMKELTREGKTVTASCGVSLTALSRFALSLRLKGAEFLYGIPGSVGGAVYMNAGAYGSEVSSILLSCSAVLPDGSRASFSNGSCGFSYRHSVFCENGGVVLSATFELEEGDPEEIGQTMRALFAKRAEKQPLDLPSAGSAFKRPKEGFAAQMIDECGLKGLMAGGAAVSEKHAGFIVNRGGATAKDVKELIKTVRDTVFREKGVLLEPEIVVVENP